jgi:hypothetical protein
MVCLQAQLAHAEQHACNLSHRCSELERELAASRNASLSNQVRVQIMHIEQQHERSQCTGALMHTQQERVLLNQERQNLAVQMTQLAQDRALFAAAKAQLDVSFMQVEFEKQQVKAQMENLQRDRAFFVADQIRFASHSTSATSSNRPNWSDQHPTIQALNEKIDELSKELKQEREARALQALFFSRVE